jgi:hypothetical protein
MHQSTDSFIRVQMNVYRAIRIGINGFFSLAPNFQSIEYNQKIAPKYIIRIWSE